LPFRRGTIHEPNDPLVARTDGQYLRGLHKAIGRFTEEVLSGRDVIEQAHIPLHVIRRDGEERLFAWPIRDSTENDLVQLLAHEPEVPFNRGRADLEIGAQTCVNRGYAVGPADKHDA
jgi:hypothetical protein